VTFSKIVDFESQIVKWNCAKSTNMVCCSYRTFKPLARYGENNMQIRPTSNIQTSPAVNLQTQNTTGAADSSQSLPVDQLELSSEAQMITSTATSSDIRADRVADLRAQIASGQYETAEKLESAVSRMFDQFA
jgi:negative regulator of flagellin synthesis FlgM